jgi:hypothetical protein
MLLAANRRSTGVGVRPREDRIEITCDFTPSPALMIATATLIVAIVREVMTWPTYELSELARHRVPVIRGFRPMPHTSRKGWLARYGCYPKNPFTCDVDTEPWLTEQDGTLTLRAIAERIVRRFRRPIHRLADPFTFRLIGAVMQGRSPSLLDLRDRPPDYEDVGRLCVWDGGMASAQLARSRYERVVLRALAGRPLRIDGQRLLPVGMRGWSAVVFRGEEQRREVIAIDDLLEHLDAGTWG